MNRTLCHLVGEQGPPRVKALQVAALAWLCSRSPCRCCFGGGFAIDTDVEASATVGRADQRCARLTNSWWQLDRHITESPRQLESNRVGFLGQGFKFQRFEGFWKRDAKRTSERWVSVEAKLQGGKQTRPRPGSAIPHVALGATSVHRQIRGAKMLQHHPVEGHSCWAECYKTMNEWCEVLPTTAFILEWLDVCVCVGTVCGMKGPRLVWLSYRVMQQNSKRQLYDVEVTMEIEGRIIHNVKMHTRGHSSAMCLGCKPVWFRPRLPLNDSSPRFPKHQFGLRLPKAIPLLGMTPARSVWIEKDASCRFEETVCSMHTIVIQYLNEQTGSVLNEFCRKKSFKVQLLHPIFHLHRYYYDYIIINYIIIYR